MDTLRAEFSDPPAKYRSIPFWSWNDRLEPAELVRQISGFKDQGMGGFFIHSREGLETPYMSDAWMRAVKTVVEAARTGGMYAWLYDEDRWPSGAAGGLVPARGGDAFRSKVLTLDVTDTPPLHDETVLAVYRARLAERTLSSLERLRLESPFTLDSDESILVLRREVAGPTEWYNDDAPADNLNPDAVAAFLEITYDAYYQVVGHDAGEVVPGIFTDEPNVHDVKPRSGLPHVPWTDGLDQFFAERRGYDFFDTAPYVFLDGEKAHKTRHDFWWTISERFAEAYSKQLGAWCEQHDLALTGHYLEENYLGFAIWRGGAIMPHYQYQQVPGIDLLCQQTDEYLTVKQCSSVAHQFGKPATLTETYGCSGWAFTFEGQKWVGDWQYVLGMTLRCQHLALYSLRGCRKRDYPPCFNYNTTWWPHNKVVEDYFARLGMMLSQGRVHRDVLVIHPIATGWMMVEGTRHEFPPDDGAQAANDLGVRLNAFVQALLATHFDFDFGDEQIMSSTGRVEDRIFWINQAAYRVVIIPPGTQTLFASTVDLLDQFTQQGGRVIAFEPVPTLVEAQPTALLARLFEHPNVTVLSDTRRLGPKLEAAIPRRVGVYTRKGASAETFLVQLRDLPDENATLLFVVNNDREQAYDVTITLAGTGLLEAWNLLDGTSLPVFADAHDGMTEFDANFGPAGSRLYVLRHSIDPLPQLNTYETGRVASYVGPSCAFTRTDPNVLTLDTCAYRLRDDEWSDPVPVWQAQKAIRERLNMRPIYYNGLPQRYKWIDQPHPNDGTPVAFQFAFGVHDVPDQPVFLALERPAEFTIIFNGETISSVADSWYLDRSFERVPLPRLRKGTNTLVLECSYKNHMEVEDCYLLGDFGVSLDRDIIAEPDRLRLGDWCQQGYLHYAGSMVYHADYDHIPGEHVTLWLDAYHATTVALHVNGTLAGYIPWRAANGFDLTPHLREGANRIGIEVVGSPRNMLGPLHLKSGDTLWTDWRSFRATDESYTPETITVPYGLMAPVAIRAFNPDEKNRSGPSYLWEDR